jgi:hypothetical protein
MNVFHRIVVAILSGIVLAFILLLISNIPNKSNNGFDRNFLSVKPRILSNVNLKFPSREILNSSQQEILISTDSSNIIISYTPSSNKIEYRKLEIDPDLRSQIGNIYRFDYDGKEGKTTLFANNLHSVLVLAKHSSDFVKLGDSAYYYAVTISSNSYVLRRFNEEIGDAIFEYVSIPSGSRIGEQNISLRSTDRGLSTDGHLIYNKENGLLSYMHYYNNIILSFDTALKSVKHIHTIDTITYKDKLDKEKPLLVSNKKSFVNGDYIFVCSNLRADNESMKNYMKNIPIDIYHVPTGTYKGSIYVPVSNRKLISSLSYDGEILSALYYDNHLILFKMPMKDFNF